MSEKDPHGDHQTVTSTTPQQLAATLEQFRPQREDLARFLLPYRSGLHEVRTKVEILRDEFSTLHDYNPIEHLSGRLKTLDSILEKAARRGGEPSLGSLANVVTDIAGLRVTCSFASDVYHLLSMMVSQPDLTVLKVKDYIASPKPSGYRSLHLLVSVPVFLSASVVAVPVEIQLRTVAMDFWASLEHKIHYKYEGGVPADVARSLREAAESAHHMDVLMEELHVRVHGDNIE